MLVDTDLVYLIQLQISQIIIIFPNLLKNNLITLTSFSLISSFWCSKCPLHLSHFLFLLGGSYSPPVLLQFKWKIQLVILSRATISRLFTSQFFEVRYWKVHFRIVFCLNNRINRKVFASNDRNPSLLNRIIQLKTNFIGDLGKEIISRFTFRNRSISATAMNDLSTIPVLCPRTIFAGKWTKILRRLS